MSIEKQFTEIRELIRQAKEKVFRYVNTELIDLYWNIGKYISIKTENNEWGTHVVEHLSDYLRKTEPELKGFSSQNLWRMKQFYETYYKNEKLSAMLRELTWTNILIIISKTTSYDEKEFYIKYAVQ